MLLHHKEIGEGKPLVILHGLFGTSDNWQTHAKKLGEYYRVILVDQRNHGHSPWSEDFTYEHLADDLERLILDLGIDKFTLIGHSMGGKTAMYYSQKYPTRLEKMVIVDIGIKQYPMHHNEIIKGIMRTHDFTVFCIVSIQHKCTASVSGTSFMTAWSFPTIRCAHRWIQIPSQRKIIVPRNDLINVNRSTR